MGRASGLLASSVNVILHNSTPKCAICVRPVLHSRRRRTCALKQQQACLCTIRQGMGCSGASLWLKGSSLREFRIRATTDMESRSYWGTEFAQADVGRCSLISAATVFLIHHAVGEERAIAATYSSAVIGQHYSSFSVDSLDHCSAAPRISASKSFAKKNSRVGISYVKLGLGSVGVVKPSTVGLRKPVSLVKRPVGSLPRLKNYLMARQIACSFQALPIASVSAATLTNSFNALTRQGLALDLSVLRSSFGTSVNLLSLCTLVVWMQRSGQLPADTPVILSQVAFKLFIPCFLMSKVATTLTSSSASNLVALPLMAFAQVIVGAALGKLASQIFFKAPSLQPAVDFSVNQAGDNSSSLLLTEDHIRLTRAATKKQALIIAACAFGNSLTLPLVFLSGVLATAEEANRAAGYLALYMVGWSPAMWSVGYKILTTGDAEQESDSIVEQSMWQSIVKGFGSVMNPPLYGVCATNTPRFLDASVVNPFVMFQSMLVMPLAGLPTLGSESQVLVGLLIGGTPLSHLFLGGQEGTVLESASVAFDTVGVFAKLRSVTAGILSPLFEAVSLLGTATLAVQTVVLATSLGASLSKPGEQAAKISHLEVDSEVNSASGQVGTNLPAADMVLDSKAFWVISTVRLILLPFSGIFFSFVLQCWHMLPPDPIYRLVILAESSMPTAQNLVLLAQLNPGTRPLAGMLAALLLRQYALSVFPLTLWMAIFLTLTPVS